MPWTYGEYDSGYCGEDGENCGIVVINDYIRVYSYGGAGGGAALTGSTDSGSGAGGYPGAGIGRRWSRTVAGGDHELSAGGFTGGKSGKGIEGQTNGLGSICYGTGFDILISPGGGYYSFGVGHSSTELEYESWFGEGGCWSKYTGILADYWSTAGSGGTAGRGGIIKHSLTSIIEAYNGNRITENDFDYSNTCYEYDKDGKLLDGSSGREAQVANVITFVNDDSKKIIPAKIFIQDGIRRAVYDNLCYMSEERKEKYGVNKPDEQLIIKNQSPSGKVKNVQIISEDTNITHFSQGIGSGAGYIELDNGAFEVID